MRFPTSALLMFLSACTLLLAGCPSTGTLPTAAFFAAPSSGSAPLTVRFFDISAGSARITAWAWTFGNGATSEVQNPQVTYTSPGSYSVSLTVTSDAGSDTTLLEGLITVTEPEPEPEGEGAEEGDDTTEGEGTAEGEGASEGEGDGEGQAEGEGEGFVEGEEDGEGELLEAPVVVRTEPQDAAANVPVGSRVRVFFDRALLSASVTSGSVVLSPETPGATTYGAGVITFTPAEELLKGTEYTVTLSAGIASLDGATLGAPFTFTFTTVPAEPTLPLGVVVDKAVFVPGTSIVALSSVAESSVLFVDHEAGLIVEEQILTNPPQAMALAGSSLYVADQLGTVFEFDAETGAAFRLITVQTQPHDIAITNDGRLFIAERRSLSNTGIDSYNLLTGNFLGTAGVREERQTLNTTIYPNELWGLYTGGSPQRIYRYVISAEGIPQEVAGFRPENYWSASRWIKFDPTGTFLLTDKGDRMFVLRNETVTLAPGSKLANQLYDVLFDVELQAVITAEPDGIHAYDLDTFQEIGVIAYAEPESAKLGWNATGDTLLVVYRQQDAPSDEILFYPLDLLFNL